MTTSLNIASVTTTSSCMVTKPIAQAPIHRMLSDSYQDIAANLLIYLKRRNVKLIITVGLGDWQRDVFIRLLKHKIGRFKVHAADDYFVKSGVYEFCKEDLTRAHVECHSNVLESLNQGYTVLVANTNSRMEHIYTYAQIRQCVVVQFKPIDLYTAGALEAGMNWGMVSDWMGDRIILNPILNSYLMEERFTFERDELHEMISNSGGLCFDNYILVTMADGSLAVFAPATLEQTSTKSIPGFVYQQVFFDMQNLKIESDAFPTIEAVYTVNVKRPMRV